jgi:Icc-related predicted phosphoesterase
MKIDCIADLHGNYPQLEGGDLLIVAGDLLSADDLDGWAAFEMWLRGQEYRMKVVVAGNHDMSAQVTPQIGETLEKNEGVKYLCDSGTEFEGVKIWGCPWTLTFDGINPKCTGFVGTEEELKEHYDLIPEGTQILVTHGPSKNILDKTVIDESVGSTALSNALIRVRPLLHVHGHIHEAYGYFKATFMQEETQESLGEMHVVNCSYVDSNYEVTNQPFRINLDVIATTTIAEDTEFAPVTADDLIQEAVVVE